MALDFRDRNPSCLDERKQGAHEVLVYSLFLVHNIVWLHFQVRQFEGFTGTGFLKAICQREGIPHIIRLKDI